MSRPEAMRLEVAEEHLVEAARSTLRSRESQEAMGRYQVDRGQSVKSR